MNNERPPAEERIALRTIAMPADTNPSGDIFGGWLLAQMDLAGSTTAIKRCRGRVATVAVDSMTFHRPVYVGDEVSVFTDVTRVGRTSLTVHVDVWVCRGIGGRSIRVTEGLFTFVAIDDEGSPRQVPEA